jgi:hypothetical protein
MDDSDKSNVDRVGHRRWCLDPCMKKTAFGGHDKYAAMYSFDGANQSTNEPDMVAYPSRGYFPMGFLHARAAWSLSLNPRKYAVPRAGDVKVAVRPADESYRKGAPAEITDFTVNTQPFGMSICVIFRPEVNCSEGKRYWVEVSGVRLAGGAPAEIEYLVEFFKP